jgi:hypothetical protein
VGRNCWAETVGKNKVAAAHLPQVTTATLVVTRIGIRRLQRRLQRRLKWRIKKRDEGLPSAGGEA